MHETSILILFVFLLENMILMFALGPREFCTTPGKINSVACSVLQENFLLNLFVHMFQQTVVVSGFVLDVIVLSVSLIADLFIPENASVRYYFYLLFLPESSPTLANGQMPAACIK